MFSTLIVVILLCAVVWAFLVVKGNKKPSQPINDNFTKPENEAVGEVDEVVFIGNTDENRKVFYAELPDDMPKEKIDQALTQVAQEIASKKSAVKKAPKKAVAKKAATKKTPKE